MAAMRERLLAALKAGKAVGEAWHEASAQVRLWPICSPFLPQYKSGKFRDQSAARFTKQIASYYYQDCDQQMVEDNFTGFSFLLFRNEVADGGDDCHAKKY